MWLAPTTVTSLLLRRGFNNNKSVSSKSCRAALLLIHQNSSSSSFKFGGGGGGTFILHQQANNNLHTTATTSSTFSKFGHTFILQTYEPPSVVDSHGKPKYDIKMFMLSSRSGSGDGDHGEEDKDDDLQEKKKKKKKKKKKMFKLDEDLGFSALYKDFQLRHSLRMVGSCNGIICLHDPFEYSMRDDVYIWNPATRQFRILPELIHIQEKQKSAIRDFVGFGFDVETNDYKVLRITPFIPDSYRGYGCMCRVQVYSLSTNSWRLLDGIDSLPVSPTQDLFLNRQGTYLNGSCFFLGRKPINYKGIRDLMLLSFDFTKEIFTIRQLPEKCRTMHKLVLKNWDGEEFDVLTSPQNSQIDDLLSELSVATAAFRTPRIDFASGYVFTTPKIDLKGGYWYYDMWVLSEQNESGRVVVHEEAKLWTKLHEFRIKTESNHPYSEPICVSNDREFALISKSRHGRKKKKLMFFKLKKLMLFNLVTGEAIKDFTIGDRNCRAAYVYKESQVSIMGENVLLRWQLPSHGTTYKLNLDAPFIDSYSNFGIGLCLTSDTGGCIGVRSVSSYSRDAEVGEAEAMVEAIKWAKELKLSPIIIESNSKNMVSFFMEDDDDNNSTYWSLEALKFLTQAKLLLNSSEISSISFQYCSRSCNYVVDIAAKLGRDDDTAWSYKDWTANFPGEVVMSLSKDLGLETFLASKKIWPWL